MSRRMQDCCLDSFEIASGICQFLHRDYVAGVLARVSHQWLHIGVYCVLKWRGGEQAWDAAPTECAAVWLPATVRQRIHQIKASLDEECSLHDWQKHGISRTYSEVLAGYRQNTARLLETRAARSIPLLDVTKLSPERFRDEFAGKQPVVITGLAQQMLKTPRTVDEREICEQLRPVSSQQRQQWSLADVFARCCSARTSMQHDSLITLNDERANPCAHTIAASNPCLRVGEDSVGNDVFISLIDYLFYTAAAAESDDTPLYVFEQHDAGLIQTNLLPAYDVPMKFFPDDLLGLTATHSDGSGTGEEVTNSAEEENALDGRPPYKWWLVGVAGTGTEIHVDPPGTDAWNALLCGSKEWVMVAPSASPREVCSGSVADDQPALSWFRDSLVSVAEECRTQTGDARVHIVTQPPGSVVYIPSGWWHTAWNSSDTLAFTQNFMTWQRFCLDAKAYLDIEAQTAEPGGPAKRTASGAIEAQRTERCCCAHERSAEGESGPDSAGESVAVLNKYGSKSIRGAEFAEFATRLYGLTDADSAVRWLRVLRTYAHASRDLQPGCCGLSEVERLLNCV